MKKRLKGWPIWSILFVAFCFLLFSAWWLLKARFDVNKAPPVYGYVEKFEQNGIPDFQSGDFSLSTVKSPVVIVNFWASWCGPCVAEFPSMIKLVEASKGRVTVVAVSQDEDESDFKAFIKLFKVPRPGFYIVRDLDRKISTLYGVDKLPESFIAGPDRKLIRKVLGIEDWASAGALSYFDSIAR